MPSLGNFIHDFTMNRAGLIAAVLTSYEILLKMLRLCISVSYFYFRLKPFDLLLCLDGDLYESARDIMNCLLKFQSRVMNGCLIVFDNFVWQNDDTSFIKHHEVKAFYEFLMNSQFVAYVIGSVRHSAAFYLFKS